MTIQRVVVLTLLTIATFVGGFISRTAILAQGRIALTATQTESVYNRAGQLKTELSSINVIGVRSDASSVLAKSMPKPGNRGVAEIRHIYDLSRGEEVIVDGLTDSFSTLPILRKGVELYKKAASCATDDPRVRSSMLGYDVVHVVEERARTGRTIRVEKWLAPALNCMPLKQIFYIGHTAADLYAANVKEVTQVSIGDPPSTLFEKPAGYTERYASQRREEFARRYPEVPIPEPLREADRQEDEQYHRRQADRGK
jgi:hypothetical protein